jgi:restriction endonuclease S subunit
MIRKRLQNLVEIQSGYQARHKVLEDPFGSHRLLQARDIQDSSINWQGALCFNPEGNPKRYMIQPQDILFVARGYKNMAYNVPDAPDNLLASSSFYIIRVTSPLLVPGFLGWWLNQAKAQAFFSKFQVRSGFVYMSKKNLNQLQVPLPTIATQNRIAELQQLWSKEQSLTRKIHQYKNQLIKSVCSSAITQKEG